MKRFFVFISLIVAMSPVIARADKPLPFVVAIGCPSRDNSVALDPKIARSLADQLKRDGKIDIGSADGSNPQAVVPNVMNTIMDQVKTYGDGSSTDSGQATLPIDQDLVNIVVEQLNDNGRFRVVRFDTSLPMVQKAISEKKLSQKVADAAYDPVNTLEIARSMGADYALRVQGYIVDANVNLVVELISVNGTGRYLASSGSVITYGIGSRAAINRKNALSTAASDSVSQIIIQVFGQGALLEGPIAAPVLPLAQANTNSSTAQRDTVSEYALAMRQSDAYIGTHDPTNAVIELRRAINLKPGEIATRLKLAGLYSSLGMTAEAIDECKRALLFTDNTGIHNMLAKLYLANGSLADAAAQCLEVARLDPSNPEVRINLGDIYWNQGKIDDATSAYEDAVKLSPANPAPHERLERLYSARKMYALALDHAVQAKEPSPNTDAVSKYKFVINVAQDEFNSVLGKLIALQNDFGDNKITEDDYYMDCKDAATRVDALSGFMEKQSVPDSMKSAHLHGVLAISLLAQSSGDIVRYLETKSQHFVDDAGLLQDEAKAEMDTYAKSAPVISAR